VSLSLRGFWLTEWDDVVDEERIRGLDDPVEGQQLVHDDLSHALHLRLDSIYWLTDQAAETHRCEVEETP
jgi:hypothetical protein